MNKIRLKQPKYILPAILYFPLLGLGWLIIDIFQTEIKHSDGMETTEYLNAKLPPAYTKKMGSKRENMQNTFRGIRDYTAVQNSGADSVVTEEFSSRYSEDEVSRLQAQLDSAARDRAERQRAQARKSDSVEKLEAADADLPTLEQIQQRNRESRLRQLEELDRELGTEDASRERLTRQMRRNLGIDDDSVAASAAPAAPSVEEQINDPAARRRGFRGVGVDGAVTGLAEDAKDNVVFKTLSSCARCNTHFNTISSNERESRLITAIIDEELKAVDGSRVRLRLLDDAEVNGHRLQKGTYLYATLSGFSKQRVQGTVESVLIGDELVKVGLSIYDMDGLKGLYVPGSSFREAAKDIAGSALQGTMNVTDGATTRNSMTQYAVQALQNSVQRITSSVSKAVKKNKVRIKYGTQVYLINGSNSGR